MKHYLHAVFACTALALCGTGTLANGKKGKTFTPAMAGERFEY